MSSQAALYQILFQNDILFQLETIQPVGVAERAVPVAEKTPVTQPAPAVKNTPTVQAPSAPALQELPALKHQILILTEQPGHQELAQAESVFLDNILKAVKYSIDQADLINISFLPPTDASKVISERKTARLITFGVPTARLNLDLLLTPYTPKQINGVWCLLADPLGMIEADRELKKKLWQALQAMF
ncbi:hypothetical protein DSL64_19145 [Dyadobacter luteus]|jgi:hypothetical protein|uniref:Uncharacterized protein n=1 Tax=Dyadobacter luteus TaxID=2259619 RepID=A0A3D8Y7T2_9BACT|nr:hypothetical protein [Dyadobacter luteus]REA59073.1 hypothetical protein DSL64_19145 [Dyadobacter luteus]